MLPKNGVQAKVDNPLDARLIVLLPILKRIWAFRRVREIC